MKKEFGPRRDLLRLQHPAGTRVTAGKASGGRPPDFDPILLQRFDIPGIRRILPHAGVHRGGKGNRSAACADECRDSVIRDAACGLRDRICCGGGDNNEVSAVRKTDMRHNA